MGLFVAYQALAKGLLQQGSRKQGARQGFSSPSQGWEIPQGWKNPHSEGCPAKLLHLYPRLLCLVKLSTSVPSMWGSSWSKEAPKAARHHSP